MVFTVLATLAFAASSFEPASPLQGGDQDAVREADTAQRPLQLAFQDEAQAERLAIETLPVTPAADSYGLGTVQDVTALTPQDAEAYYGLLHHAASVPGAELRKAGREFVTARRKATHETTFPDMLHHPEAWRGKPVTLDGHLLQTVEFEAADNPYGIKKLYESALYTDDSAHHPMTVVFLEKPDNLPLGGDLVGSVGVSGYFLKLYVYPSSDKKSRKAPIILAKTITVFPPPKRGHLVPQEWLFAALASIVGSLALAAWLAMRSDRHRLQARREEELDRRRPDFRALR